MVNNAIDHSKGSTVNVRWFLRQEQVAFEIDDDGVGAFASIRKSRELEDDFQAVGELSKASRRRARPTTAVWASFLHPGWSTSSPSRRTGLSSEAGSANMHVPSGARERESRCDGDDCRRPGLTTT